MTIQPRDDSPDARTLMLRFECDYCHVLAGEWCVNPSGKRATYLHSARYYRWRERAENNG